LVNSSLYLRLSIVKRWSLGTAPESVIPPKAGTHGGGSGDVANHCRSP
jgi:hypothetical protein